MIDHNRLYDMLINNNIIIVYNRYNDKYYVNKMEYAVQHAFFDDDRPFRKFQDLPQEELVRIQKELFKKL